MNIRYTIILSDSESIETFGPLPRVGDQIYVQKTYGARQTIRCRVANVRHTIAVNDVPDNKDVHGFAVEGPEVFVCIESGRTE